MRVHCLPHVVYVLAANSTHSLFKKTTLLISSQRILQNLFLTCEQSIITAQNQTKLAGITILHYELNSAIAQHINGYATGDIVLAMDNNMSEVLYG